MKVTITSGSARTKPKTGDVRTTKKHGLQIRVPEMSQIGNDDWAYVVMNGRLRYEWKAPQQLVGTRWEHLTVRVDGKIDSVANIAMKDAKLPSPNKKSSRWPWRLDLTISRRGLMLKTWSKARLMPPTDGLSA